MLNRQFDTLRATSRACIFDDRGSGAEGEKPGLRTYLDYLRSDDVLVMLDLDRLGRLVGKLIRLIDELQGRGLDFRALNAAFDSGTPMSRAFLHVEAAFADMERNVIRQRVREGAQGGQRRVMTLVQLRYARHLMADREYDIPSICRELGGVPASTLHHYLRVDGTVKTAGIRLLDIQKSPHAARPPPV